ncbi:transcription antitermination factor NusB [Myxococcota bacterium]|nr:transcription antitermination factor NusB [Myxococcota bacterium]MBU1429619.1 transcription antitermination factor NusB [Myxococcota bacterium]MBU1897425.1 transcription antitermination factor NusB [Myxococcota bacterium]
MISGRRAAREIALLILFGMEVSEAEVAEEALRLFIAAFRDDPEVLEEIFARGEISPGLVKHAQRVLSSEAEGHWGFVEALVRGVTSHRAAIDELIIQSSLNWRLERMGRVDRNILRLAVFELAFELETPGAAALNEAIEMAKRYGTIDSGKFVNGILDRIGQKLERIEKKPANKKSRRAKKPNKKPPAAPE